MKYTDSVVLATFFLGVTFGGPACETSKAERAEPAPPPPAVSSLSQDQTQHLIERAEKMRDRTFEERPALEAVTTTDELPSGVQIPDQVASERELLIEQLFGQTPAAVKDGKNGGDAQSLEVVSPPFSSLAGYDKSEHRVVYLHSDASVQVREAAIVAALVQALDAQHFDALPEPTSWDEQLALQAANNATVSFALAHFLLDRHRPDTAPDLLARRPELAGELPVLADWFGVSGGTQDLSDKLDARQQAFVLRQGWTLAAALYRSSGWSGVELSRLMPPKRSADVVRPDQWMAGEAIGEWSWPQQQEDGAHGSRTDSPRAGKVGPAIASMWLEDVIAPQLARTIYAGYISDAYRFFEGRKESPASFEWLSVWNSPDSARQVAAAFEKRLRRRFEGTGESAEHFVVFQKGLTVGVILSAASEQTKRARAQELLDGHKLALKPREGLPTSYVPTRQDQLLDAMQTATLKRRQWVDPATRLRLDLSALGEGWRVQQPDHGPVRWFASHPSGSLLQLTVELDDPFGPSFSSDAYRERLVDAFQSSIEQAKLEHVAPTDVPPERGLLVRVSGQVDHATRTLQLWQFERDDLIVSYSLQAPPEVFEEHKALAESILEAAGTLETTGASHQADQPRADETQGSIEYQVED